MCVAYLATLTKQLLVVGQYLSAQVRPVRRDLYIRYLTHIYDLFIPLIGWGLRMLNYKVLILGDVHSAAVEVFKRHGIHADQMRCVLGRAHLEQTIASNCYNVLLVGSDIKINDVRIPEIQMVKSIGLVGDSTANITGEMLGRYGVPLINLRRKSEAGSARAVAEEVCTFLSTGKSCGIMNRMPSGKFVNGWRHKVRAKETPDNIMARVNERLADLAAKKKVEEIKKQLSNVVPFPELPKNVGLRETGVMALRS